MYMNKLWSSKLSSKFHQKNRVNDDRCGIDDKLMKAEILIHKAFYADCHQIIKKTISQPPSFFAPFIQRIKNGKN